MRGWQWLGLVGLMGVVVWSSFRDSTPVLKPTVRPESDFKPISRPKAAPTETKASKSLVAAAGERTLAPGPAPVERPFPFQSELDLFAKIRKKVFLNESEQAERRRLLNDASLLRALGTRLTETSLAPSVRASQDTAVDLLVEALKSGDKSLASEVLRAVVEDPQVENSSLERSLRENLAGIKAEVLYHWAALVPEEAGNIGRYLPGPVSRKIWDNVAHRHASNRAESAQ